MVKVDDKQAPIIKLSFSGPPPPNVQLKDSTGHKVEFQTITKSVDNLQVITPASQVPQSHPKLDKSIVPKKADTTSLQRYKIPKLSQVIKLQLCCSKSNLECLSAIKKENQNNTFQLISEYGKN